MIIEYAHHDTSFSDKETRELLKQAGEYGLYSVSVFQPYIKTAKSILPSTTKIACPIDYPLGVLDTRTREKAITECAKLGADIIDVVCQTYPLCNRKYDKFREDIKILKEICEQNKIKLRYILEYRLFTYELLYKVAQILSDNFIDEILPSSGYLLDDINDNILASALINKKVPKIKIINNGNIWNQKQIENLLKYSPFGIRLNSINGLDLISKKMP